MFCSAICFQTPSIYIHVSHQYKRTGKITVKTEDGKVRNVTNSASKFMYLYLIRRPHSRGSLCAANSFVKYWLVETWF